MNRESRKDSESFFRNRIRSEPAVESAPIALRSAVGSVDQPNYVLLTRRVEKAEGEIPGFPDQYHCPRCDGAFVLAWHPSHTPMVNLMDRVPPDHPCLAAKRDETHVFCPECEFHDLVSRPIAHPISGRDREMKAPALATFHYPLSRVLERKARKGMRCEGPEIKRVVIFVTGRFPESLAPRVFAELVLSTSILPRFRGRFRFTRAPGNRLHIHRVARLPGKTSGLGLFIQHSYGGSIEDRVTLSTPGRPIALEPPLGEMLPCHLDSASPGAGE